MNYTAEQVVGKNVVWTDWDGRRETSTCTKVIPSKGININDVPTTYYMLYFNIPNHIGEFSIELAVFNIQVKHGLAEVVEASDVHQNEEIL
jgi:hypothetical protein